MSTNKRAGFIGTPPKALNQEGGPLDRPGSRFRIPEFHNKHSSDVINQSNTTSTRSLDDSACLRTTDVVSNNNCHVLKSSKPVNDTVLCMKQIATNEKKAVAQNENVPKPNTANNNRATCLVNGELHSNPSNHDSGKVVRNSPGRDSDSDNSVITPNLSPSILRAAHLRTGREHSSSSMSEVESELGDLDLGEMEVNHKPLTRQRRTKSLYGASPNCKFGPKASIRPTHVLTIQDPGSQRLVWSKEPNKVLIIKKIHDTSVYEPFIDMLKFLISEKRMFVFIDSQVMEDPELNRYDTFVDLKKKVFTYKEGTDDLTDKIDFIICLGGDGTLLYASSLFQSSVPPVMAFHMGSLGFLMPFDFVTFKERINQVLQGDAPLILRTRLKCVLNKKDQPCASNKADDAICSIKNVESKQHIMVLNEVVVDRGPSAYICNLDLYIEHKYITSIQGDGLIISTPTGSTAYAAAAGASMVHPNIPAIMICPICPHSLSFRPIAVPAGVEIKCMVSPEARSGAYVSFDGRNRMEMDHGDVLRISTSIYPVPSICASDQMGDWFASLAGCLHWNVRKQQKRLSPGANTSNDSLDSC